MSRFEGSIPAAYFDEIYAADPDPWRFAASAYERDKYAATIEALPHSRYSSALEIGCSIGVLTRQIAACCDAVLALDIAREALDQAARRCADLAHVRFERMQVPGEWPRGHFDLILLSEVVYYLDRADVYNLASRVESVAASNCDIVLVHWLGETHYPLTGDEAAEHFMAAISSSFRPLQQTRSEAYRLDVLGRSADGVQRSN